MKPVQSQYLELTSDPPWEGHNLLLTSGLQYSDSFVVATMLLITIPSVGLWTFFAFTGSARKFSFLFAALTNTLLCFYMAVGILTAAEIDATLSVPLSTVCAVFLAIPSFWSPEITAFPLLPIWVWIILLYATMNLINPWTPFQSGLMATFPAWLLKPVRIQSIIYNLMMLFLAACMIGIAQLEPSVSVLRKIKELLNDVNFCTSFLSGWIAISGFSYIAYCCGLIEEPACDSISLFSFPTKFRWAVPTHVLLFIVWQLLAILGYLVQRNRELKRQSNLQKTRREAQDPFARGCAVQPASIPEPFSI